MASDEETSIIQPKVTRGISLHVTKLNKTNYITRAIIAQYKNAREIWAALKAQYVGAERVQKARFLTLKSEFEKLKMEKKETVDQFAGKITGMVSKAMSLGYVFEQDVLVKKLLDAVPDKYFKLVASIKQTIDLNSMRFEDAVGRLKAFEERLRGRERASESQSQLLFNRSEGSYKGKSYDQSGSRGKGGPSSWECGRGRETGDYRILSDVYFIPSLKDNIISLGQATENGCYVRMKENYFLLYDDGGKLMMKAFRTGNRLYTIK
ncbi:uncharacterized protein LOC143532530 [Bidens hawaiensis]|uniref:uncharacterized protein LOC143532530 n=1 Tax=Bidens hawaiensis TaxID=980011 RepID=UPI00404A7F20